MSLPQGQKAKKLLSPVKILAALVFLTLLILAVIYRPNLLSILPLFISVFILFLQTRVNRFAYLLGAANSILYAVAYYLMTLYSQATYALLVSCPVQVLTFFLWQKNTAQGSTRTRKMTARTRCILVTAMLGAWISFYFIFKSFGSEYLLLDNTVSIIGIVSTVLAAFRFSEYALFSLVSGCISLVLYSQMLASDPSRIIWLVFTAYSVMCCYLTFMNMNRKVKATQKA